MRVLQSRQIEERQERRTAKETNIEEDTKSSAEGEVGTRGGRQEEQGRQGEDDQVFDGMSIVKVVLLNALLLLFGYIKIMLLSRWDYEIEYDFPDAKFPNTLVHSRKV